MATEHHPGLDRVQRWMQALIQDQGTCEEAIASERAQAEIPADQARTVVLPSKTLSSFERLDIYREMYLLRMEEALSSIIRRSNIFWAKKNSCGWWRATWRFIRRAAIR